MYVIHVRQSAIHVHRFAVHVRRFAIHVHHVRHAVVKRKNVAEVENVREIVDVGVADRSVRIANQ